MVTKSSSSSLPSSPSQPSSPSLTGAATPLWRNGPANKPVLCNACGTRYSICGNLDSYMPKHFHEGLLKNLENISLNDNVNADTNKVVKDKNPSTKHVPASGVGRSTASFWSSIPRRKRSRVVYRKLTPMEKFHRKLYSMWKNDGSPDENEDVLLERNLMVETYIPSNEIGLGAMLLKPDYADDVAPKNASN